MPIHERRYEPYDGPRLTGWRQRLVIPRYAYEEAFASRRFLVLYAACFLPTLVALLIVFLHHNVNALLMLDLVRGDLIQIGPRFFQALLTVQSGFAFLVALLVGPNLISADMAHNALPLFLSRPISRADYAAGKILVVFLLMSCVTWVASGAVFALEGAFAGWPWLAANAWVLPRIVLGGIVWSLLVSTLVVALSAWLRWRPVAAGAMLAVFLLPTGFAEMVNQLFGTRWGYVLSPTRSSEIVSDALFRQPRSIEEWRYNVETQQMERFIVELPPAWVAALSLLALAGAALWLLNRRLRAHEVVT